MYQSTWIFVNHEKAQEATKTISSPWLPAILIGRAFHMMTIDGTLRRWRKRRLMADYD
jgi:hypothetical protein